MNGAKEAQRDDNKNINEKTNTITDGCAASMNPQRASTANELHLIF